MALPPALSYDQASSLLCIDRTLGSTMGLLRWSDRDLDRAMRKISRKLALAEHQYSEHVDSNRGLVEGSPSTHRRMSHASVEYDQSRQSEYVNTSTWDFFCIVSSILRTTVYDNSAHLYNSIPLPQQATALPIVMPQLHRILKLTYVRQRLHQIPVTTLLSASFEHHFSRYSGHMRGLVALKGLLIEAVMDAARVLVSVCMYPGLRFQWGDLRPSSVLDIYSQSEPISHTWQIIVPAAFLVDEMGHETLLLKGLVFDPYHTCLDCDGDAMTDAQIDIVSTIENPMPTLSNIKDEIAQASVDMSR